LHYRAFGLSLIVFASTLCAVLLRWKTNGIPLALAGFLLMTHFVAWSIFYSFEQRERRQFLVSPMPLSRRQVARARVLAASLFHLISFALTTLFLALGNAWEGQAWQTDQGFLWLFNGLFILLSFAGFLLEEFTVMAQSSRWRLIIVNGTYLAMIMLASVSFSGFFAVFFEGDFDPASASPWIQAGLNNVPSLSVLIYLIALAVGLLSIELYARRKDLNACSGCASGVGSIWSRTG
jgi:hypothetical protein